jgi:hypothetical protein
MADPTILTTNKSQYDVFLCHNSKEKEQVEKIREQLKQKGILAWLDKYDFEPFRRWQDQLEEIIPQIKAVAVFIGSSGVGPWADIEMREFLGEFATRQLRMGLVILPGCPQEIIETVPRFMKGFHWVDFRQQVPDPMEQLIWGITGRKSEKRTTDGLIDDQNLQTCQKSGVVEEKLNESDKEILTELLTRSGRAGFAQRDALCIKIGIDSNQLDFLTLPSNEGFAIKLVNFLYEVDDKNALYKLCKTLGPMFKQGKFADNLANIKSKLNCSQ